MSMPRTGRKAESCCFDGCSQANLLRVREAAGIRLTEVTYPPGLRLPQHSHEQSCFCFLLHGLYDITWGKQILLRKPGSLTFTASGEIHSNRIHSKEVRCFSIEMTRPWLERANGLSFAKTLQRHKSRPVTMLRARPHAIHFKRILDFGVGQQFKAEAQASSRLYRQDVDWHAVEAQKPWKQPFKIAAALFSGIMSKLSPARRVLLLITLVLAVLSLAGFGFLFLTKEVEFLFAFLGMLILLVLVLGDHVTMKRDVEIAREIQRWLVPRVPPEVPGVDMAFATRPANTVAGDYYDAFRRANDGPLLIAVADVTGKSVPAAMLMANFQASLRALAGARSSLQS
jgi:quercetin dioxygenase-like cupin family protein